MLYTYRPRSKRLSSKKTQEIADRATGELRAGKGTGALDRTTTIVLTGAQGRMGRRIATLAAADPRFVLAACLDRGEILPIVRQPSIPQSLAETEVVVDFSSDEGAREALALAQVLSAAILIGTTALSPTTLAEVDRAAASTPVMVASNTSLGVAVLRRLAEEAARLLGAEYDIDIVESHHNRKLDAPSGTALSLAASLEAGGRPVSRERIHALRCGDVIGDHLVQFAGPGEIVTLRHAATDRDLFARGALRAARWLAGRKPGHYRIEDTFG
jgi:4-hydroxy-tetrahydrodipicolinate reductase